MKYLLLLSALLAASCASNSPKEAKVNDDVLLAKYRYYSSIRDSVEPKWFAEMNSAKSQLKRVKLKKDTVSRVKFDVDAQGAIKNIKIMKQSLAPEADKLALRVIQKTKRLPKPPAEILENGKLQMDWEYVLKK